jgi:hypothetical protein
MLENSKLVLSFGLREDENEIINKLLKEEKLSECRVITKEMASMSVKDIVNGLKIEVVDNSIPEERVILLNNYTDEELDRTIKAIRANLKPGPILAVVTPTSIDWSFKYLLEHLIEEREWFRSQKRGN